MKDSSKGTVYALMAVAMFATLGTAFKIAVTHMSSYSVVVWMGFWATLTLFLRLAAEKRLHTIYSELRSRPVFFPLAGVIGLGLQQILCLKTYEMIPASQAIILHYTYPLVMLLFSWIFFREKTGGKSLLCVVAGFSGVCVLVISGGALGNLQLTYGVLIGLATSFSFALFCILIKHADFPVTTGMFLFNLFGLLFLLSLMPFYQMEWMPGKMQMFLLAYLGVFPTAIAFIFWNRALRMIPTSRSSNSALMVPILSLIFISVLLKEKITPFQGVGMAIVLASVFMNVKLGHKS